MLEIEVKGLEKIQKASEDVARKLSDGSLVARAALVIERQIKMNWGHGKHQGGFPNVQTGRLRASISIELLNRDTARVGTNVFYAPFVEFGHQNRLGIGRAKLRRTYSEEAGFSNAYPFFYPAIEQTKGQIGDVVVTFGNEIGSAWGE